MKIEIIDTTHYGSIKLARPHNLLNELCIKHLSTIVL